MNTNELRRGNLIFEDVLSTCTVESVFNNKLEVSVPNGKTDGTINKRWFIMDSYNFRPIPLTEEWLLDLGFEYFKANNSYQLDTNLGFCIWGRIKDGFMIFVNSDEIGIKITTVHQLQNLYFALTKKELTQKNLA